AGANAALPAEAALPTPAWCQPRDPVRPPTVTVTGAAAAMHAASYGWELAAGCGVQPTEDRFTTIASASGLTASSGPGTLASWSIDDTARRCAIDVSGVQQTAPSGTASPDDTPDGFTVTLRLRVTIDAGRRGESRRTL